MPFRPGAEALIREDKISKILSKGKQLLLNFFKSEGSGSRPYPLECYSCCELN